LASVTPRHQDKRRHCERERSDPEIVERRPYVWIATPPSAARYDGVHPSIGLEPEPLVARVETPARPE